MEIAEPIVVQVDSKGRICIPAEMRGKIGEIVVIQNTPQGILITPGKREDFIESFNKMITSTIALYLSVHYNLGGTDALITANYIANKTPTLLTHDKELLKHQTITYKNNNLTIKDPLQE